MFQAIKLKIIVLIYYDAKISSNSTGTPNCLYISLTHNINSGPTPSPGTKVTFTLASFNTSGTFELGLITLVCGGVYKTFEFDLKIYII